ncbi:HEAT repeat domain-containing protein [Archangium lipolyticum]|uniref:HEAT repeat domain-containing protein n=1 Tax=Archangium lipolyticum TaxID=2970465 RepID=UPI002149B7CB|nr:HEAT repeat domain-containing protein [Archangium lipolyticum]
MKRFLSFLACAVAVALLGPGCAHAPAPAVAPADANALRQQAEAAYFALDFPRCAGSYRASADASQEAASRAELLYSAACCASLAGVSQEGLGLLRRAVQEGYAQADTLAHDPELRPLHALEGWDAVLAQARANAQKALKPPPPLRVLAGVDVYGSRRVDAETVRRAFGFEVGQPFVYSQALVTMKENGLRRQYALAFSHVAYISYHAGPEAGRDYITVDLVDEDEAWRLKFLPEPAGHPEDPEGLVARWREYEDRAWTLLRRGELDLAKPVCRVTHCSLGFGHAELSSFEPVFVEKVPAHVDALGRVLREDADPKNRAAAAFLLAYVSEPGLAIERLVGSIRDSSPLVRNNVLRVLGALQRHADRPLVELPRVLDAMALPQTTDRNKATSLLVAVLEKMSPSERAARLADILRQAGEQLVAMTALQQPINRDPARTVLERLSGEQHDAEGWRVWLQKQQLP